jgi:hypothetical protein
MARPSPITPRMIVWATMKFVLFMKIKREIPGLAQKVLGYIALMENLLQIKVRSKVSLLGQYKQFLKIKKVDFGLVVLVDFIDAVVSPFLMLQRMVLGNSIIKKTNA